MAGGLAGWRDPDAAMALGIQPGYPSTLRDLPAVRPRVLGGGGDHPGAKELVKELVTLPTHSWVTTKDRNEVLRLLNTYGS